MRSQAQIKHGKDGPFVPGLTSHPVRSAEEVREKFKMSQKSRSTATTQMNDVSYSPLFHPSLLPYPPTPLPSSLIPVPPFTLASPPP